MQVDIEEEDQKETWRRPFRTRNEGEWVDLQLGPGWTLGAKQAWLVISCVGLMCHRRHHHHHHRHHHHHHHVFFYVMLSTSRQVRRCMVILLTMLFHYNLSRTCEALSPYSRKSLLMTPAPGFPWPASWSLPKMPRAAPSGENRGFSERGFRQAPAYII